MSRFAALRDQHVHHFRNGLLDTDWRVRPAQTGADPARRHQDQRARYFGITRGVATHELVKGGLAGAIDIVPATLVVADASLSRRHDADKPNCGHEVL